MIFEFDPNKNRLNQAKHGVSFAEAISALSDPFAFDREDLSAIGEQRFLTLGMSEKDRLLVVLTAPRRDTVRLISAWQANKHYREQYESQKNRT